MSPVPQYTRDSMYKKQEASQVLPTPIKPSDFEHVKQKPSDFASKNQEGLIPQPTQVDPNPNHLSDIPHIKQNTSSRPLDCSTTEITSQPPFERGPKLSSSSDIGYKRQETSNNKPDGGSAIETTPQSTCDIGSIKQQATESITQSERPEGDSTLLPTPGSGLENQLTSAHSGHAIESIKQPSGNASQLGHQPGQYMSQHASQHDFVGVTLSANVPNKQVGSEHGQLNNSAMYKVPTGLSSTTAKGPCTNSSALPLVPRLASANHETPPDLSSNTASKNGDNISQAICSTLPANTNPHSSISMPTTRSTGLNMDTFDTQSSGPGGLIKIKCGQDLPSGKSKVALGTKSNSPAMDTISSQPSYSPGNAPTACTGLGQTGDQSNHATTERLTQCIDKSQQASRGHGGLNNDMVVLSQTSGSISSPAGSVSRNVIDQSREATHAFPDDIKIGKPTLCDNEPSKSSSTIAESKVCLDHAGSSPAPPLPTEPSLTRGPSLPAGPATKLLSFQTNSACPGVKNSFSDPSNTSTQKQQLVNTEQLRSRSPCTASVQLPRQECVQSDYHTESHLPIYGGNTRVDELDTKSHKVSQNLANSLRGLSLEDNQTGNRQPFSLPPGIQSLDIDKALVSGYHSKIPELDIKSHKVTQNLTNSHKGLPQAGPNPHSPISPIQIIEEPFDFACHYTASVLQGLPPLFLAAAERNPASVQLLLRYGANPNYQDSEGCTPLHLSSSVEFQSWECAVALIENGSRVSISKGLRELSFLPGGGPSVCDGRSPIFPGPPLCLRQKNLVPPFAYGEKFWSPPLTL